MNLNIFYIILPVVMTLKYNYLPKFRKNRKSYPKFRIINKMMYDIENFNNEINDYEYNCDYIFNETIPESY